MQTSHTNNIEVKSNPPIFPVSARPSSTLLMSSKENGERFEPRSSACRNASRTTRETSPATRWKQTTEKTDCPKDSLYQPQDITQKVTRPYPKSRWDQFFQYFFFFWPKEKKYLLKKKAIFKICVSKRITLSNMIFDILHWLKTIKMSTCTYVLVFGSELANPICTILIQKITRAFCSINSS